jgi:hypothetical protein
VNSARHAVRRDLFDWSAGLPRVGLFLFTDEVFGYLSEVALRELAELIVAAGLLADDKFAAVVGGVKPLGVGGGAAADAVEANPGAQFDERASLGKSGGFFILDADPGAAQTVFLRRDGADQNLIAAGGGANLVPIARGRGYDAHEQHGSQHHGNGDPETPLEG